ncbi:hypothetical protein ACCO45_006141 [Purpureocillium lilacinum]|uniref:Uncharacterized protein n=1 Tax=Purpureocillium lilacinum TaxID=33203 RepID=A0ACC4DXG5_PURLI
MEPAATSSYGTKPDHSTAASPSSAPCEAVPGGVCPPAPFAAITSGWGCGRWMTDGCHAAPGGGKGVETAQRRTTGAWGQAWEGMGQLGVAIGESPRPCLVVAFPLESDVSLSLCGVPDPAWDGAPSSFGPNHDPPPLSTSRAKRASERQTEKQDAVAAAVAAGSLLEKRNKLWSWFDCPRALASSHRTAPRLACLDEPSIVVTGCDRRWIRHSAGLDNLRRGPFRKTHDRKLERVLSGHQHQNSTCVPKFPGAGGQPGTRSHRAQRSASLPVVKCAPGEWRYVKTAKGAGHKTRARRPGRAQSHARHPIAQPLDVESLESAAATPLLEATEMLGRTGQALSASISPPQQQPGVPPIHPQADEAGWKASPCFGQWPPVPCMPLLLYKNSAALIRIPLEAASIAASHPLGKSVSFSTQLGAVCRRCEVATRYCVRRHEKPLYPTRSEWPVLAWALEAGGAGPDSLLSRWEAGKAGQEVGWEQQLRAQSWPLFCEAASRHRCRAWTDREPSKVQPGTVRFCKVPRPLALAVRRLALRCNPSPSGTPAMPRSATKATAELRPKNSVGPGASAPRPVASEGPRDSSSCE